MAATKRPQNKCKKCGYTWYPRGAHISLKCPSCGSSEVGFAGPGVGILALFVIAVMVFGGSKKEAPAEAPSAPPVNAKLPAVANRQQVTQARAAAAQSDPPTDISNARVDTEKGDAKVDTSASSECVEGNEGKPSECSTSDCANSMPASQKCQQKRAPQNELY
ncbi:hypothetical protein GTP23_21630 [Pseudoduganella sp. FT93W]|uniref:Uncharacterized protein n=1 Tax=Duganella fentianensis TaxID=2692177 RepID=A0A845I6H5_9BURK|nr:hypothetical protein [Duganella fentianensis]MYN47646.1 hypothetical protein [Duganella fentianensis]